MKDWNCYHHFFVGNHYWGKREHDGTTYVMVVTEFDWATKRGKVLHRRKAFDQWEILPPIPPGNWKPISWPEATLDPMMAL